MKDEQSKNAIQSDSAILDMFVELQDEFSGLKKELAETANSAPKEGVSDIHLLLGELKNDIETLKDEQMKSVEVAHSGQSDEIQGLLQELKGDIANLNSEQMKMRDLLPESGTQPNPSSKRINNLLSQLKDEIDTARGEDDGESGTSIPGAGGADIDTLSTVNSVLTLLIGENAQVSNDMDEEDVSESEENSGKIAG